MDAAKVINALNFSNFESSIARLERQTVNELHETRHGFTTPQMGDVDAFNRAGRLIQLQHLTQSGQTLFGSIWKTSGCACVSNSPRRSSVSSIWISSRKPGRFFKILSARCFLHFVAHLFQQSRLVSLKEHLQSPDIATVLFFANSQVTRSGALIDAGQQARSKPLPALVAVFDVQTAGAKLEDALHHLQRPAQRSGAGEGSIEFRPEIFGSRVTSTRGKSSCVVIIR